MTTWKKRLIDGDEDFEYICPCGQEIGDEGYNADNGTMICPTCQKESPDLANIPYE